MVNVDKFIEIILKLFDAFSIQRWSDRVRPVNFIEMDKHASKAFISYFLGKHEEKDNNTDIVWNKIIYGNFFSLLYNIVVSDIKSNVSDEIKKDKDIKSQLDDWVLKQYKPLLDKNLWNEFYHFLKLKDDSPDINYRILQAANKLSTFQEYQILKSNNKHFPGIREIDKQLKGRLPSFSDIAGFNEIYYEGDLSIILSIIDNLRNQVRWGQSVRIPPTSVLGHCFFVASLTLLFSRELNASPKRLFNNFFCGLFHDIPEALTRDIISPVKESTPDFVRLIVKIEKKIMEKEFKPFIDDLIYKELKNFTVSEFENKKIKNDYKTEFLKDTDDLEKIDKDGFNLLDGKIIKLCDDLAAFIEAMQSMRYGITSPHLESGYKKIYNKYTKNSTNVNGINVKDLFVGFNDYLKECTERKTNLLNFE